MNDYYRIIDANLNRVCEGLRVVEDWLRFSAQNKELSSQTKQLRHTIRDGLRSLNPHLIPSRRSDSDVGFDISQTENKAHSSVNLLPANFKRAQEGLRVIEENLRILGHGDMARRIEQQRFSVYTLESVVEPLHTQQEKRQRLATDLYGITAFEHSRGRSNVDVVKAMLDAGVQIIQYREKDFAPRVKLRECDTIRRLTLEANAVFIVNDHPDLAMMVAADGLHIGQDDWPPDRVRSLVGPEMIIGLSTHSPEQAQDAMKANVDYIGVGPIFSTQTKKDVCSPVGFEYLDYAVHNVTIPFVAIGGIKEHNLKQVVQHGARCIALVTEIVGADDVKAKVQALRRIIREE